MLHSRTVRSTSMLNVVFSPFLALSWHVPCNIHQKSLQKGKKAEKNLGETMFSYFNKKQALCLLQQGAQLHRCHTYILTKHLISVWFSFVLVTDRKLFKASLLLYLSTMPALPGSVFYLMFIDDMNEKAGQKYKQHFHSKRDTNTSDHLSSSS